MKISWWNTFGTTFERYFSFFHEISTDFDIFSKTINFQEQAEIAAKEKERLLEEQARLQREAEARALKNKIKIST